MLGFPAGALVGVGGTGVGFGVGDGGTGVFVLVADGDGEGVAVSVGNGVGDGVADGSEVKVAVTCFAVGDAAAVAVGEGCPPVAGVGVGLGVTPAGKVHELTRIASTIAKDIALMFFISILSKKASAKGLRMHLPRLQKAPDHLGMLLRARYTGYGFQA